MSGTDVVYTATAYAAMRALLYVRERRVLRDAPVLQNNTARAALAQYCSQSRALSHVLSVTCSQSRALSHVLAPFTALSTARLSAIYASDAVVYGCGAAIFGGGAGDFRRPGSYFKRQLETTKVDVRLNTRVSAQVGTLLPAGCGTVVLKPMHSVHRGTEAYAPHSIGDDAYRGTEAHAYGGSELSTKRFVWWYQDLVAGKYDAVVLATGSAIWSYTCATACPVLRCAVLLPGVAPRKLTLPVPRPISLC
eukprot:342483-Rhodomonas_salina.3